MDINRIIEYFLLKKKVHERKKALLMMDPSANCRIENDPSKIYESLKDYLTIDLERLGIPSVEHTEKRDELFALDLYQEQMAIVTFMNQNRKDLKMEVDYEAANLATIITVGILTAISLSIVLGSGGFGIRKALKNRNGLKKQLVIKQEDYKKFLKNIQELLEEDKRYREKFIEFYNKYIYFMEADGSLKRAYEDVREKMLSLNNPPIIFEGY